MSKDVLDKVYEPFYTTKPKGIGTGLGLSTVHGIVTQAGGHIEIDTREGAGTTFRIFLPATNDEPIETEDAEEIGGGPGTQTVLLCEDQEVVRKMTARILENNGYTVLQARNGANALEVMRGNQQRIDLLLSDVVMPHMSGMELGRRVADAFPEVRILYMSGYSNELVSARRLDRETPPVIAKPFAPETLLSRVREALEA
jgi:CheY-like chemotaxis protein